ncbi:MAG: hypothetical protein M3N24_00535 [Actinomycetota bacterium]|nr:hypothetical protein [Actinomycetota bacterium]
MKRVAFALVAVSGLFVACAGPDRSAGPNGDGGPATRRSPSADSILGKNAEFSCIEEFSVKSLAKAKWAFDGTVTKLDPLPDPEGLHEDSGFARVTFRVNHWYKGDEGDLVTRVALYSPNSVSSVEEVDTPIGARILASGTDENLWDCGFSKEYSPKNARLYEDAFGST